MTPRTLEERAREWLKTYLPRPVSHVNPDSIRWTDEDLIAFAREVRNEALEEAAKVVEFRSEHLRNDDNAPAVEKTMRAVLEIRAEEVRTLKEQS